VVEANIDRMRRLGVGKLDQRVAVITGGARGIGREIAVSFAREGARCVVGDLLDMGAVSEEIKSLGQDVLTVSADVSKKGDIEKLISTAIRTHNKLDILVNNAGIPSRKGLLEATEEEWDEVFGLNLRGVFLCTQFAAKHMAEKAYGRIINITSIAGFRGASSRVSPAYAVSKAGVMRLTRSCAKELGPHGITVNAIAPGLVLTELPQTGRSPEAFKVFVDEEIKKTPLGRAGTVQDVAKLALFLASDEASFLTGQIIALDGGRSS
jgi:3-oxoacyl-[acyl-carrier protein] reductase